jgi:4-amino-4-deoxychorismate lyase
MLVNGEQGNSVSICDRDHLHGDGVFRTIRASQGQGLRWPLYYQKLQHDYTALWIPCLDFASLSAERYS